MAARVVLEAPDLAEARLAAEAALDERRRRRGPLALGMLRPLTPMAPGTHRYRATFALWEAGEDRFVRIDVHHCEVWAADAPERPPPRPAGDPQGGRLRALLAHPPGRPRRPPPAARAAGTRR